MPHKRACTRERNKSKREYQMLQALVMVSTMILKGHITFDPLHPKFNLFMFIFVLRSTLVPSVVEIRSVVHKFLQ